VRWWTCPGIGKAAMNKVFGIAALVLAILAIFIPLCAVVAALPGDRALAAATPLIVVRDF
jgi:hypothetical protein